MKRVIYILIDPRDQQVRYVGYTKDFMKRVYWHLSTPKGKHKCATFDWLKELCSIGMLPASRVVEELSPEADWQERERYWIKFYRESGSPLLNRTEGGHDGGWGWHRMTPENRARRIEKIRNNMPEVAKGFWDDKNPEQRREIMRARGLAKVAKHGPGGEHLMGNKLRLGIPTSTLQKKVASQANRNRWANYTPEQRAGVIENMRQAQRKRSCG